MLEIGIRRLCACLRHEPLTDTSISLSIHCILTAALLEHNQDIQYKSYWKKSHAPSITIKHDLSKANINQQDTSKLLNNYSLQINTNQNNLLKIRQNSANLVSNFLLASLYLHHIQYILYKACYSMYPIQLLLLQYNLSLLNTDLGI